MQRGVISGRRGQVKKDADRCYLKKTATGERGYRYFLSLEDGDR